VIKPAHPNHWEASDFPDEAVYLRPVRILPGDRLRTYLAISHPEGMGVFASLFNRSFLKGDAIDDEGAYALIDVLDEEMDIIDEIGIADRKPFQLVLRRMGCKVDSTDGVPV
jgi:hypothetical protein